MELIVPWALFDDDNDDDDDDDFTMVGASNTTNSINASCNVAEATRFLVKCDKKEDRFKMIRWHNGCFFMIT